MSPAISQLALAVILAVILVSVIIAVASIIQRFGRKTWREEEKKKPPETRFREFLKPDRFILVRVLVDKNGHASLALFQFMVWTLLVAVLFATVYILRLLNNLTTMSLADAILPATLIGIMGISVLVPPVSKGIDEYQRMKSRPDEEKYEEPDFASMLEEKGQPSLLRFQMFLWTLAAVVIYTAQFFVSIMAVATIAEFRMPDIDPTFLYLMGISQVGYLSGKLFSGTVEKTPPATAPGAQEQKPATVPVSAPSSAAAGQPASSVTGVSPVTPPGATEPGAGQEQHAPASVVRQHTRITVSGPWGPNCRVVGGTSVVVYPDGSFDVFDEEIQRGYVVAGGGMNAWRSGEFKYLGPSECLNLKGQYTKEHPEPHHGG